MQLTQNSQWEEFDKVVEVGEDLFELSVVAHVVSTERSATNLQDVHHTVLLFFILGREEVNPTYEGFRELLPLSEDFATHNLAHNGAERHH